MSIRLPRVSTSAVLALGGGLSVALSLPPWGFWPMAFVGIVMFEMSLGENASPRQRAARGWLFAAAWMYPGMAWMWSLTVPGYFVAAAVFAGFHAACRRGGAERTVAGDRAAGGAHACGGVAPGVPVRWRPTGDVADRSGRRPAGRYGPPRRRHLVDMGGFPDRLRPRRPLTVRTEAGAQPWTPEPG